MQIWPAIDLRGGQCVRLQQGDYSRETVFGQDPAEMARHWVEQGADQLHLVDLDGARDGEAVNLSAVREILQAVQIPCELGGGVRNESTIEQWLAAGISRLVVGTQALKEPDWFRAMCLKYPDKLALGLDARDGQVATDGWLETSSMSALSLVADYEQLPLAAIIYTDIARDGMMAGPNVSATAEVNDATSHPVIASGGVTSISDVEQLAGIGVEGCIIGRTLYEGKMTVAAAKRAAQLDV